MDVLFQFFNDCLGIFFVVKFVDLGDIFIFVCFFKNVDFVISGFYCMKVLWVFYVVVDFLFVYDDVIFDYFFG